MYSTIRTEMKASSWSIFRYHISCLIFPTYITIPQLSEVT